MAHITVYNKFTGEVLRYCCVPDGEEEAQLQSDQEAYEMTYPLQNMVDPGPKKPPGVENAIA